MCHHTFRSRTLNMSVSPVDEERPRRNPLRTLNFWLAVIAIASLIVGSLGAGLAYLALQQPDPEVAFETIGETNVLDLRRPLQDLDILFRGQNVQEQNLHLRILTINVANIGDVDILPAHYDHNDDWGMRFSDGEVIEVRLIDASSDYLRSKVVPQRVGADTVVFPKVIFEKSAFFVMEVLLLHSKDDSPSFSSIGKIAGIDKITVLTRPIARQETSFAKELFQGSTFIQVSRAVIYFIGSLLLIVLVALVLLGINDKLDDLKRHRRKNRILQSRTLRQSDHDDVKDFLISHYESGGTDWLRVLQEVTRKPEKLKWITPPGQWVFRDPHAHDLATPNRVLALEFMFSHSHALDAMAESGLLKKGKEGDAMIDPELGATVDRLVAELED